ncbi:hypothetical protein [Deminuibacter soli]|uniref:Uncharacterized protein n=1 Tax=Deminuibacter soli TaxID=2291815 RepID=A0A3E1NQ29_9BACT|nr:hypothetical protein [Deminuibacter soli]RFM30032.1 hypothetical protein DXN05_03410 [Deminuibacter soli]
MNTGKLSQLNLEIISNIKQELRLQGHFLTGALEQSLHDAIAQLPDGVDLQATALGYIEDLEKGVPSNHIAIDATSIAAMTRYVQLRMGYKGKQATKVAIAILKKQQKEGMPTRNSYQFSKTGNRLESVADTFYKNDNRYTGMIDNVVIGELDAEFNKTKSGIV